MGNNIYDTDFRSEPPIKNYSYSDWKKDYDTTANSYHYNYWDDSNKNSSSKNSSSPMPQQSNTAFKTAGKVADVLSVGADIASGAGWLSGGTGFVVAGIMQLASSLLGSFFSPKPKQQRSAEERYFDSLVQFYSKAGERSKMARAMASQITGKPVASYAGKIGYDSFDDAFRQNGFTPLDTMNFGEQEEYNPPKAKKKVK